MAKRAVPDQILINDLCFESFDIILPDWQKWIEEHTTGNEEGQKDGHQHKLGQWIHLPETWRWDSDSDWQSRSVAACFHSWAQAEEAQAPLSHSISP